MPRIPFRRILPVVQLALFVALVVLHEADVASIKAQHIAVYGFWDEKYFEFDTPIFIDICGAINAPALLLAMPFLAVANLTLPDLYQVYVDYVLYGMAVVGWWYLMGLRLDQVRGLIPKPRAPLPPPPMRRHLVVLFGAVAACLVFGLLALVFAPMGYMRYTLPSLTLWFGFAAVIQVGKMQRRGLTGSLTTPQ